MHSLTTPTAPRSKTYIDHYSCRFVLIFVLFALSTPNLSAQTSVTAKITVSVVVGSSPNSSIPSSWIDSFFGDIDPNYEITSTSDYDGDGQFDYLEYYAGTDPTDGASGLRIIESTLSGNDAVISWTSTDDIDPEPRKYRVFRSGPEALGILAAPNATIDQLSSSPDIASLELDNQLEIPSNGATTTYTDLDVKDDFPLFYRVFLSKPEPQAP